MQPTGSAPYALREDDSLYTATTGRACALPGSPLDKASAGLDLCVHCGFCLPACPTYLTLEDENDSPRGRILLMRQLLEGSVSADDSDAHTHFDHCLSCRACETACPSGVPYGELIEATRASLLERRGMHAGVRLILGIFAAPLMLHISMWGARVLRATGIPMLLARILPRRLGFPLAMLASTAPLRHRKARAASRTSRLPDDSHTGPTVATLDGCVMEGLFAHVNRATERCIEAGGCTHVKSPGQGCCGALHAHAGDLEGARELARINIAAFEKSGADFVVVNSAGCGAMMKEYGRLLEEDAEWSGRAEALAQKTRDASEFLAAHRPPLGTPVDLHITHDAPCHQMHAQRIVDEPLDLLKGIPGVTFTPLVDADQCCGSAGIYSLLEPAISGAVLESKLEHIHDTRASVVATGNPGCLMQIGAGLMLKGSKTRAVHPIELLDLASDTGHGALQRETRSAAPGSTLQT